MARKKQSKQARLSKPSNASHSSSVRIIAGQWRGRKLAFASDVQGLRPTPDRTRETLFNWLQGDIYEARCLDLFAGSGALGFEALSRGAAEVTFVEKHPRVVRQLEVNSSLLKVKNAAAQVVQADAFTFLQQLMDKKTPAYDIIFLDPPFRQGMLSEILMLIEKHSVLASSGMLYMEYEVEEAVNIDHKTAENNRFILYKKNKAGQVISCLYQFC